MNIKLSGIVARPESRFTPEGKQVLTFSVGMYTGGNKEAGYKESAWVRVEAWESLAEAWADKLIKGMRVTVTGQAKTPRKYEKDGVERDAGFEVVAREIAEGDAFRVETDDVTF